MEGLIVYRKDERILAHGNLRSPSEVVAFGRDVRDFGDLPAQPGWKRPDPDAR
jgi:hypothetical protein